MLDSKVYSWGLGDGGLLGLGNTDTQLSPKVISSLNDVNITYVACGGLHTLAINKQGHVYSWGRGEGGQLGIPSDQFGSKTQESYSSTPKRIRGAIDGKVIVKVAAGEAHSLALTQNGEVYGWGYTNSGQLGLGYTNDGFERNAPKQPIRIAEPVLIEKLKPLKIIDIFAGATFSFFMNDKKEVIICIVFLIRMPKPFSYLDVASMIRISLGLRSQRLNQLVRLDYFAILI
jgi:E3 ubiquitin-protein ligase HERC2